MSIYIGTFGDQTHEIEGLGEVNMRHYYVSIDTDDYLAARKAMFANFGGSWCFVRDVENYTIAEMQKYWPKGEAMTITVPQTK